MKRTWLAILIIIILAMLAYFVYWARNSFVQYGSESVINQLEVQGTSDEVEAIESDLNATSLEGLDSELSDIEKELEGAGI